MKPATLLLFMACALTAFTAKAQTCASPGGATVSPTPCACPNRRADGGRITEHQWLWGAGAANVLDTYLSPLEYTGPNLGVLHRTERTARWGGGRVTAHSLYTGHLAYLHSPTDDGMEWDTELTAAGGWLYNWRPAPRWRLAAGGLMELSGGFTYNTRGSNNPAQGRMGLSLAASGLGEYRFPLFGGEAVARAMTDVQLAGMQFSPEYGQSYYEIFSLGHSSGIIHLTQPGNCPTVRLQAQFSVPIKKARLTVGYLGDIRQSKLGGLKRHAWRHTLMLGYTRQLRIIR